MREEEIVYLTVDDVLDLHQENLERYGGRQGREPGKLEAKLALPMSGFGDYIRYPSLIEKAAVYHYHLASGHCFIDGNKRTSYSATFLFLAYNGYDLIATDDEIVEWTTIIADDKTRPPFTDSVAWIKKHIRKL